MSKTQRHWVDYSLSHPVCMSWYGLRLLSCIQLFRPDAPPTEGPQYVNKAFSAYRGIYIEKEDLQLELNKVVQTGALCFDITPHPSVWPWCANLYLINVPTFISSNFHFLLLLLSLFRSLCHSHSLSLSPSLSHSCSLPLLLHPSGSLYRSLSLWLSHSLFVSLVLSRSLVLSLSPIRKRSGVRASGSWTSSSRPERWSCSSWGQRWRPAKVQVQRLRLPWSTGAYYHSQRHAMEWTI